MKTNDINEQNSSDYQKKKAEKALLIAKEVEAKKTVKAVRLNHKTIVYRNVYH